MGFPAFLLLLVIAPVAALGTAGDEAYARLRAKAIERSPELVLAREALEQKRAKVHTSIARWLPRLELQLSENTAQNFTLITSGQLPPGFTFTPPVVTLGGWAVNATLPIYRRSVHVAVRQALAERDAAELTLAARTADVDWRLRQLFGNYLLGVYKVATVASSIEVAKTNSREAHVRFDLGQRTRIDLLRSEANVATLEAKRLTYAQELDSARSALAEYVGLDEAEVDKARLNDNLGTEKLIAGAIDAFALGEGVPAEVGKFLDDKDRAAVGDRIASSSPYYRSLLADAGVDDVQAESLTATEWPEVALAGSLSKQARDWGTLFDGRYQSYQLGITLTIPLSLGGSVLSTASEKAAAERSARVKRERETMRLRNEVENQRLQVVALRRAAEAFRLSLEQNQEIVRLSAKSYELGKTTLVEWLGSQNDLIDSKINYAKSRIDLAVVIRRFAANLGVALP